MDNQLQTIRDFDSAEHKVGDTLRSENDSRNSVVRMTRNTSSDVYEALARQYYALDGDLTVEDLAQIDLYLQAEIELFNCPDLREKLSDWLARFRQNRDNYQLRIELLEILDEIPNMVKVSEAYEMLEQIGSHLDIERLVIEWSILHEKQDDPRSRNRISDTENRLVEELNSDLLTDKVWIDAINAAMTDPFITIESLDDEHVRHIKKRLIIEALVTIHKQMVRKSDINRMRIMRERMSMAFGIYGK